MTIKLYIPMMLSIHTNRVDHTVRGISDCGGSLTSVGETYLYLPFAGDNKTSPSLFCGDAEALPLFPVTSRQNLAPLAQQCLQERHGLTYILVCDLLENMEKVQTQLLMLLLQPGLLHSGSHRGITQTRNVYQ